MFIEKGFIDELQSEVYIYDLDGLKVIFVDKECEEFAFNGTIYNKHKDDKGLPHMVEHCIFGGSLKFDFDEPFEYVAQNKRYTYLNAITFRDRTVCPFSTYSKKDFDEILEVYLDSIFNPFLREKTFKQECVRLNDDDINGIVYNEMLEMYSDKNYAKEAELLALFDCDYLRFNSHGKPNEIKNASYNEMMDYYHKNFTKDNIVLSFYGKFEHEKYLSKVFELSKTCNNKMHADVVQNNRLEIKVNKEKESFDIIFAYESQNFAEAELLDLFFDYLIFENDYLLKKEINQLIDLKSFQVRKNNDLKKNLVIINIVHSGTKAINLSDIYSIFENLLSGFDYDKMNDIFVKKIFEEKNSDFGYKTTGIYTLLEISKHRSNIFSYYNLKEIDFSLEEKDVTEDVVDLVKLINVFSSHMVSKTARVYDNCCIYEKKSKFLKKNFDNCFIYSTEYDIINAVTVINYDKIGFLGDFDLNKVDVNNDFFEEIDFIRGFYSSRMQSETHDLNGFYLHISILENNRENALTKLQNLFSDIKFEELFKPRDRKLSYNLSINDLINIIIHTQKKDDFSLANSDTTKRLNPSIEFYLVEEDMSVKKFKSSVLYLKHFEFYNDYNNSLANNFESELYKNILVLKLFEDCDFMYLELILEAFLNEMLYPKVRLLNGAYEVGYKLLKLENRVVIYSNIDKFSEKTLNTFKMEFKNLDNLRLDSITKYLNKITNNFYRNEQNKNIKIKKVFDNFLLNVTDTISVFDEKRLYKTLNVFINAEVEYELSFGKDSFRDYKVGGIYDY